MSIPNGDHIKNGPQDDHMGNVIPLIPRTPETDTAEALTAHFALKDIDQRTDVSDEILDARIEEMLKPSFLNRFRQDDRVRAMVRTIFEIAEIRLPSIVVDSEWAVSAADNVRLKRYRESGKEDQFTPNLTPLGRKILEHEQRLSNWDRRAANHLSDLINEHGRAGAVMLLFEQTAAYDSTLLMHTVDRVRSKLSLAFRDEVIQSERLVRTMLAIDRPEPIEFDEEELDEIKQKLTALIAE